MAFFPPATTVRASGEDAPRGCAIMRRAAVVAGGFLLAACQETDTSDTQPTPEPGPFSGKMYVVTLPENATPAQVQAQVDAFCGHSDNHIVTREELPAEYRENLANTARFAFVSCGSGRVQ